MNAYQRRDFRLREMGFSSYGQYLSSPIWYWIRQYVLKGKCVRCKKNLATQLHHKNYKRDTLEGRDTTGLLPVCRDCHENAEVDDEGNKRGLKFVNQMMNLSPDIIFKRKCRYCGCDCNRASCLPCRRIHRKKRCTNTTLSIVPHVSRESKYPIGAAQGITQSST